MGKFLDGTNYFGMKYFFAIFVLKNPQNSARSCGGGPAVTQTGVGIWGTARFSHFEITKKCNKKLKKTILGPLAVDSLTDGACRAYGSFPGKKPE